jgi:hypothetical protein
MSTTVYVSGGSPTLEGGGVRTAGPEDSRTRVCKSSSSRIATAIALWEVADVAVTSGGGGFPVGVGCGADGWEGPPGNIHGGGGLGGVSSGKG